jgi:hypothetical protein
MSEYSFVEKPFLDQLNALDWTVIDQGPGIPTDPTKSLRTSFREVTLRDVFNQAVRAINTAPMPEHGSQTSNSTTCTKSCSVTRAAAWSKTTKPFSNYCSAPRSMPTN